MVYTLSHITPLPPHLPTSHVPLPASNPHSSPPSQSRPSTASPNHHITSHLTPLPPHLTYPTPRTPLPVTAFYHVAKLCDRQPAYRVQRIKTDPRLAACCDLVLARISDLDTQALANAWYAHALVGHGTAELVQGERSKRGRVYTRWLLIAMRCVFVAKRRTGPSPSLPSPSRPPRAHLSAQSIGHNHIITANSITV